jgi:hypothetical protein
MIKKCDRLDGLSQTHLVGQDGVSLLIPRLYQPVHRLELIGSQKFVVFVDRLILQLVLWGLLFYANIIKVELVLHIA